MLILTGHVSLLSESTALLKRLSELVTCCDGIKGVYSVRATWQILFS